jgi:hypothetical protein
MSCTLQYFQQNKATTPTKTHAYVAKNGTNTDDVTLSLYYSHFCQDALGTLQEDHWFT